MTTGAEFANFTHKKISGFEDFNDRMIGYLRTLHAEAVSRQFIQGSFDEKMPLSSPGVDQVQIDAKPTVSNQFDCHDGLGHILDLVASVRSAIFENVVAQDYEVGVGFVERPSGIAVNPRTGKPDYLKLFEDIGDEADPDSVTDDGDGTITFRVDALFEAGVAVADHTGRQIRVFKKVPADGALTEAVAIETLTVFFGGGQNQIATTGSLGQSVISTAAADYTLQLIGPTVLKDTATNKPSISGKHFFVGVVTGNGGTPTVFDTSNQSVIQAQDAQNIQFLPFVGAAPISWDIAATDVQAAIEEVVGDLSTKGSSTNGANLVGINLSDFTTSAIGAGDSGGIGVGGNPDEPDSVEDALKNLDRRVVGRRPFTAVLADGTARTIADFVGQNVVDQVNTIDNGGRFLIHSDGGTDYEFSTQTGFGKSTKSPHVIGEIGTGAFNGWPSVAVPSGASAAHRLIGKFERLHLRSASGTHFLEMGDSAGSHLGMRDCGIDAGSMIFRGFNANVRPYIIEDCEFAPGASAGPGAHVLEMTESTGERPWIVFKRCVFRGPHASGGGSILKMIGFASDNPSGYDGRFVVFEDCTFIHENTVGVSTLNLTQAAGGKFWVEFNRCKIVGIANQTQPVIVSDANPVNVIMRDVTIYAPGGQAIKMPRVRGTWENVHVICGTDQGVAGEQCVRLGGDPDGNARGDGYLKIRDMFVVLGSAWSTNATKPGVEIGGDGGVADERGGIFVDGLFVQQQGAPTFTPVVLHGSVDPAMYTSYDNVVVDGRSVGLLSTSSGVKFPALIEVLGGDGDTDNNTTHIGNLYVTGAEMGDNQINNNASFIYLEQVEADTIYLDMDQPATTAGTMDSYIRIGASSASDDVSASSIRRIHVDGSTAGGVSKHAEWNSALVHVDTGAKGTIIYEFYSAIVFDKGAGNPYVLLDADFSKILSFYAEKPDVGDAFGNELAVVADGNFTEVAGVRVQDNSVRSESIIEGAGEGAIVHRNQIEMNISATTNMINMTGDNTIVTNNVLLSVSATLQTITNSGANSISPDNILALT